MAETRSTRCAETAVASVVNNESEGDTAAYRPGNDSEPHKCFKFNRKLIKNIKLICELCGHRFHKKCFSILPRSVKHKYFNICFHCSTKILPFSHLIGNDFREALLEFQYNAFDIRNFISLPDNFKENMYEYDCRESSDKFKRYRSR